jgi:hypothetical protein
VYQRANTLFLLLQRGELKRKEMKKIPSKKRGAGGV